MSSTSAATLLRQNFYVINGDSPSAALPPRPSSVCPPPIANIVVSPSMSGRHREQTASSSSASLSTFVETVNINIEDFSESFLTCSTCLCAYNSTEHNPKLLNCSHTVCQGCLQRILDLPQCRNTGSFRCPICRETIPVPRGGVSALPPSFIVNQLMDLMYRQRREVVPKCSAHPTEELLFCETCDAVFCALCPDRVHADGGSDHTVVPFSIAIKRMSEIMLYKASHCIRNLNRASENVAKEIEQLDRNVDGVIDQIANSFAALAQQVDRRRQEIVAEARRVRDEKRRVLQDQLKIVESERAQVEQDCVGLEYQTDVRTLTRKIGDLTAKLDVSTTLLEPRENAFVRYDYEPTSGVIASVQRALDELGTIEVSRTFPPLCTASECVDPPAGVNLDCVIVVRTIDYHGCLRVTGGDPIDVTVRKSAAQSGEQGSPRHLIAPAQRIESSNFLAEEQNVAGEQPSVVTSVKDRRDGTYEIHYRPTEPGVYVVDVRIFGRSIRNSPFNVRISAHNNPIWQCANFDGDGNDDRLVQPVRVRCTNDGRIVIADTGNDRLVVCTSDGSFLRAIRGAPLRGGSVTGLAYSRQRDSVFALNWRSRVLSEWALSSSGSSTALHERDWSTTFEQPIDLAIDDKLARLYVLDSDQNGGRVWFVDLAGELAGSFDLKQSTARTIEELASLPVGSRTLRAGRAAGQASSESASRWHDVTCLSVSPNGQLLVGGSFGVHLYSNEGKLVRVINVVGGEDASPLAGGLVRSISTHSSVSSGSSASRVETSLPHLSHCIIGGIAVDPDGFVLASVGGTLVASAAEKARPLAQLAVAHVKGDFLYAIDSHAAKMKRPAGVCLVEDGRVLVADLGNNCIKMYRYK